MDAKTYIEETKRIWQEKYVNEPEFMQTLDEFVDSIVPVLERHPQYIDHNVLQVIAIPDRIITFRVAWTADDGSVQVNTAYRVQFNSDLGPYKGGLRFHPSVNLSILKFLGFEQIFKNALTSLPIGGGKGGSDFDLKGKSDGEIMRFCQSLMTELQKHIGPDLDVPAGDIGVGAREIGYLYGQYKRLRGFENGVITGKPLPIGGSQARTQATGYGAVYFIDKMLADKGQELADKRAIVSGAGNVAIYAIEKLEELGAKALTASDSNGYVVDEEGIDVALLKEVKEVKRQRLTAYADQRESARYYEGSVWHAELTADIALPCATQNEIDEQEAQQIVANGVKFISEGANMPLTKAATDELLAKDVYIGPAKAANAGGVAVSALEMAQNSARLRWSFDDVDQELHDIMDAIYANVSSAAEEYGFPGNLIKGANIAAFIKVADAMIMQGVH
ncbi:NADP-specific glutamate dehydrogenase [Aerococcus sp. YH-aer221]|uniref:Glutamate dehydrogenase n=2 Tax=Aerococcus kribbianus TaxID=2999064 RepID=A0A9X3FNA3_9LACT|nr:MULTISPECIES: NADP-specific glutamate dehydrogenase [unclassified Aerococcus]MCZ0716903.1 NADP-specific glutamate dehydrogenase [Aerococcus sp. YH-aer221]MCZ0725191.1 NADP-specific glutamate dehydrogenase [Aerococcus sp. YH-aer222]